MSGEGVVRNSDLLYWSVLHFDAKGDVEQFVYSPNATLSALKTDDTTGPSNTAIPDRGARAMHASPPGTARGPHVTRTTPAWQLAPSARSRGEWTGQMEARCSRLLFALARFWSCPTAGAYSCIRRNMETA